MGKLFQPGYNHPKGILIAASPLGVGGLFAALNTVPSDADTGFCNGCILIDKNASDGSQVWVNTGSVTSAAFRRVMVTGGTNSSFNFSGGTVANTIKANTAAAYTITDATTTELSIDTRNTLKNVHTITITGTPVTVATEAAVHQNSSLNIAAKTITYTGTATVTSSYGVQLYLGIPTFTDSGAGTITDCSTFHVAAVAAAGGSLTLTARKMISTGVADAFLTNAGVWTDTACFEYGKELVERTGEKIKDQVANLMDKLKPASWKYRKEFETKGVDPKLGVVTTLQTLDDFGRQRVGVIYDDLPDELRAPGEERGVSTGVLSSFALAALKLLWDENENLKERLAKLEAA